jgi:beta-phosphoglucomutase-like phosphatase (HAD superfamily)
MIKALIFDCYGTLISTGNGSVEASRKILSKVKSNIDPVLFYKEWKAIHKDHISNLNHFSTEEKIFINDLKILFTKYQLDAVPEEHIKPILDSLYNKKNTILQIAKPIIS